LRHRLALVSVWALALLLSGCASDRHFIGDSLWPFGNPNAPANNSETTQRALGHTTDVKPIAPQEGNVWPGPVQPVPTIADIQKNMNEPLGQAYTPSLPSPYPPGQDPDSAQDKADSSDYTIPTGAVPQIVPASPAPAQ
jgi:hypothetical protein